MKYCAGLKSMVSMDGHEPNEHLWRGRRQVVALILCCISCLGCASGLTTSSPSRTNILSSLKTTAAAEDGELTPEQSAQTCLRTAIEMDGQDHLSEAIALYERAISMNAGLKGVSRRLAVLYARTNQSDKARAEFEKSLVETPKDASLHCDAGYFFLQSGDFGKAENHIAEALRLEPTHAKAKMHLAMLWAKQDRFEESFELFEQVVGPAEAHSNLGVILAKEGRSEEALEHLTRARELDPKLPVPAAFLSHFQKNATSSVH